MEVLKTANFAKFDFAIEIVTKNLFTELNLAIWGQNRGNQFR